MSSEYASAHESKLAGIMCVIENKQVRVEPKRVWVVNVSSWLTCVTNGTPGLFRVIHRPLSRLLIMTSGLCVTINDLQLIKQI